MSGPRIGELFAGYGGLGMGVQAVYGGDIAWVSEFDKGPSKILAHRFPGVPNHGDITEIKWTPDCPTCSHELRAVNETPGADGYIYWCPSCKGEFPVSIRPEGMPSPVDILTGGSPCQDLSHAGRRAGMTEGTRSNLWVAMREAIAQLRPSLVVWENVGGAFSAAADSEVEPCAGCVGDGTGVHLRALGRVLGDLSSLGYDASWHAVRASDVGAPHGRLRVFVVATDAKQGRTVASRQAEAGWPSGPLGGRGEVHPDPLLPTPRATDGTKGGPNQRGSSGDLMLPSAVARMLPTPTTRDHKDHTIRREPHRPDDVDTLARALTDVPCALLPTPTRSDASASGGSNASNVTLTDATVRTGMGTHLNERLLPKPCTCGLDDDPEWPLPDDMRFNHDPDCPAQPTRLLPTPNANEGGQTSRSGDRIGEPLMGGIVRDNLWGDYAAAIARWEHVLGRPAPAPTMTSTKGNPQLSPAFVEWMMGLPAGWVTDVPGITRNEALKALGNGVVPQQAAEALRVMAGWAAAA